MELRDTRKDVVLEQIYMIAEIVAAISVIASLLFVGFQLRQNTETLKVAAAETYYTIMKNSTQPSVNDETFSDFYLRGFDGIEGLTPVEVGRLMAYYAQTTRGYQILHYQATRNIFEGDLWGGAENHLADLFCRKAIKSIGVREGITSIRLFKHMLMMSLRTYQSESFSRGAPECRRRIIHLLAAIESASRQSPNP